MQGPAIVGTVFLLSLLGTVIVLPIALTGEQVIKAPTGFEDGHASYEYIERVCDTEKEWDLATDERQISNEYFAQSESIPEPRRLSALMYAWGQFIDHDIVLTKTDPETALTLGPYTLERTIKHPVSKESQTFITPAIDATTVYGDYANQEKLALLRVADPESCMLRTSSGPDGPLLPLNEAETDVVAGDERAGEQPLLNAIHTLWVREHNRLCAELPTEWTVEERFWKARQIVIEQIRHITYNEWLPLLFGSQTYLLYAPVPLGATGRMLDTFTGAAYRFGHSMISDTIGDFELGTLFFNITVVQQYGIGTFFEAGSTTVSQKVDVKVVDGVRNILFGMEDLVTRNLFRGRDMGLPTYAEICACYGTTPFDGHAAAGYEDPLLGLLREPLVSGSSLPRTLATIIADQFTRLRAVADQTPAQLGSYYRNLVNTASIARVVARNVPGAKASFVVHE